MLYRLADNGSGSGEIPDQPRGVAHGGRERSPPPVRPRPAAPGVTTPRTTAPGVPAPERRSSTVSPPAGRGACRSAVSTSSVRHSSSNGLAVNGIFAGERAMGEDPAAAGEQIRPAQGTASAPDLARRWPRPLRHRRSPRPSSHAPGDKRPHPAGIATLAMMAAASADWARTRSRPPAAGIEPGQADQRLGPHRRRRGRSGERASPPSRRPRPRGTAGTRIATGGGQLQRSGRISSERPAQGSTQVVVFGVERGEVLHNHTGCPARDRESVRSGDSGHSERRPAPNCLRSPATGPNRTVEPSPGAGNASGFRCARR